MEFYNKRAPKCPFFQVSKDYGDELDISGDERDICDICIWGEIKKEWNAYLHNYKYDWYGGGSYDREGICIKCYVRGVVVSSWGAEN